VFLYDPKKKTINIYVFKLTHLNAEFNPICHLLALLGAHPFLHVSRIRVNRLILVNDMQLISCIAGGKLFNIIKITFMLQKVQNIV
jgi:hypothetical protein